MPTPAAPARVLIVGTGLIGTSVALALRARNVSVWLSDIDADSAALAAGLGAGTVVPDLRDAKGIADVAVLAMPPDAVAETLALAQDHGVARWYTDVASVKAAPAERARERGCDLRTYLPGHPLAGRERHGPAAARADLFLGRTWALCPLPETSADATAAVTALAEACGADVVVTDTATHDRWVALVSHAPHVVSAAMAARLATPEVSPDALRLAGRGLRDVTRIAAGDPALWSQILSALAADLHSAARSLGPPADNSNKPRAAGDAGTQRGPSDNSNKRPAGTASKRPASTAAEKTPAPEPGSARGSVSVPAPESAPASASGPEPVSPSAPAPAPASATGSVPAPVPGSESVPDSGPESATASAPESPFVTPSTPASSPEVSEMSDLLERGRAGAARIPGKRGDAARAFAVVQVVMADRPGELARLFAVAGEAGVNVEDVRIEHAPGHPTGVAEISVRPAQAADLLNALTAHDWTARS